MATIQETASAIERHIGFPSEQTQDLATALRNAGVIGDTIDLGDFLVILTALAADLAPEQATDVERYLDLMPNGINPEIMPESVREKIGLASVEIVLLAYMIGAAGAEVTSQRDLSRLHIEFVSTWPEIAITQPDGEVERFLEIGALASHWGHRGLRRSITINGSALVDTIRELFPEEA